jgi:hypothetical protein
MTQLDQAIDAAHNEAERIENDARAIEARIIKAGALPPARPYGRPVDPAAIAKNLTLKSVLQRRDPALAAYLGVGSDLQRRRDEEEATRALQAESLRMKTEQARQQNQAAAAQRYRQQMAPLPTGWRS